MKTFTFRYSPNEAGIAKRLKNAVNGKPFVRPDEMVCEDLKSLLRVASEARLELFQAIVRMKPSSLYELAEKTGKSQSYVLREARVLESLGLIELLRETDGGRERLRPRAKYSKIIIDCGFGETKEGAA